MMRYFVVHLKGTDEKYELKSFKSLDEANEYVVKKDIPPYEYNILKGEFVR